MVSITLQIVYLLLYLFLVVLLTRFVMGYVMQFAAAGNRAGEPRPPLKWCGASPIRRSKR